MASFLLLLLLLPRLVLTGFSNPLSRRLSFLLSWGVGMCMFVNFPFHFVIRCLAFRRRRVSVVLCVQRPETPRTPGRVRKGSARVGRGRRDGRVLVSVFVTL